VLGSSVSYSRYQTCNSVSALTPWRGGGLHSAWGFTLPAILGESILQKA